MTPQKRLVRLFYDEMWNKADKSRIPEIFHPDFRFRGSLGPVLRGHAAFAGYVDEVLGSLPDFHCEVLEMTEEAERVVARLRFSGSQQGSLLGVPARGRRVAWDGSAHFRFRDGLVEDLWVLGDLHGLLQQLTATRSG